MDFDFQITNIGWQKNAETFLPYMTVYNLLQNELQEVLLDNFTFSFNRLSTRLCIGYYTESNIWIPCPRKAVLQKKAYERCFHCEKQDGFKAAFLFGHEPNEKVKKHLNQDHFIYLAYFHDDVVKVGTAAESRKEIRLLEQDALFSTFISKLPNAQDAQKLERKISKQFGITESIRSSRKFKFLSQKISESKANDFLHATYKRIIAHDEFTEAINLEFNPISFVSKPFVIYPNTNPELNLEPQQLQGIFAGLRGKFLLIHQQDSLVALDIKELVGSLLVSF